TIKQRVINSDIEVAGGNVTSISVGGIFGSHIEIGVHPPVYSNITATTTAANWDTLVPGVTFKLGSFKTTGTFDPTDVADTATFRDSFIIAQQLGTVNINGLDPAIPDDSASVAFGIAFRL